MEWGGGRTTSKLFFCSALAPQKAPWHNQLDTICFSRREQSVFMLQYFRMLLMHVKWKTLRRKNRCLSMFLPHTNYTDSIELSATQILYSWFYPYPRCRSCQMFCFCSWSTACAFNQNFDNSQKYAHVEWNMEYENASTCTNTALIQTLHHLLCTLHQLLNLHRITTFRIHSPYRKITTATLTNLYKKIHLTAQISQVPPGRNMYGVMKTTISTIISNYCHYQSTSSGR